MRTLEPEAAATRASLLFNLQRKGKGHAALFFVTLLVAVVQGAQPQPRSPDVLVIGVVTLRQVPEGKPTSIRVVTNPDDYTKVPGLQVMTLNVPKAAGAAAISGIVVGTPDGTKQSAEGAISFIANAGSQLATLLFWSPGATDQPVAKATIPVTPAQGAPPVSVTLQQPSMNPTASGTSTPVTSNITTPQTPTTPTQPGTSTSLPNSGTSTPPTSSTTAGSQSSITQTKLTQLPESAPNLTTGQSPNPDNGQRPGGQPMLPHTTTPSMVSPGGISVIHSSDSSGDANLMRVLVDGRSMEIVAADPNTLFWRVSPTLPPGPHQMVFYPGPHQLPVTMPLYVIGLEMSAGRTELIRGQSTQMQAVVTGLENLPADAWQSGAPPTDLVSPDTFRSLAGFHPPKAGEPGMALLIIENLSPAIIRMGKGDTRVVLQIHQKDAKPYVFRSNLQSMQSGGFNLTGALHSFLKQVDGQPFTPPANERSLLESNTHFNPFTGERYTFSPNQTPPKGWIPLKPAPPYPSESAVSPAMVPQLYVDRIGQQQWVAFDQDPPDGFVQSFPLASAPTEP
jgi:hypothetical protein